MIPMKVAWTTKLVGCMDIGEVVNGIGGRGGMNRGFGDTGLDLK